MHNNSKLVIFDFDGTLADTLGALMRISNRLAPEFGYPQISDAQFANLKYLSSWEIIRFSKVALWKLPFLLKRVKEEFPGEVRNVKLFPGVVELLNTLKLQGYRLGIVSSNAEANIRSLLKQHQIEHLFDFVNTASTFGKGKAIGRLIKQYQCSKSDVIYIGDEIRDIQAARSIAIRIVAVGWGFNAPTALMDKQPDLLITKPLALINALARFYPTPTSQLACL
ncbi:HAD-IA family hydrolase [Chamaesiphon sp. VAR_48_metabat_135_sub]|uniref:HAD-IA family hydrolase n=1 Tax=Chamaesiphon sp. VAR_48_metabat_135_sub TaxID=2964699 RepID=UPI00286C09E2|nr:HAD-IA family hydrolase [Chamaesiphon sp. VAR_48_metabat_135_sub]